MMLQVFIILEMESVLQKLDTNLAEQSLNALKQFNTEVSFWDSYYNGAKY